MAGTSDGKVGKKRNHMQLSMDVVPISEGKQLPAVTYFPTPFNPCESLEKSEEAGNAAEMYRNTEKFKTGQVQLVVRTSGNVDYVGGNAISESVPWQPTVFAMGVFDKEAGTLKVVPVLANKVLRMEPKVRGVSYKVDEGGNPDDPELDYKAKFEKQKSLVDRFGTKKSKLMLQKLGRSRVQETALTATSQDFKGILDGAVKQEGLVLSRKTVLEQANESLVRKIPPYNLQATTPEDAYPLNQIIPAEEWEAIDVDELFKASKSSALLETLQSEERYPRFVLDRLHRIKAVGDREGNLKRAKILVYLCHLLNMFHATRGRVFQGRDPDFDESAVADIPRVVYQKLRSLFVVDKPPDPNSRSDKVLQRDYLLSYILVLGLKVDGHEVDPYDVATALKMTVTGLEPHYRQLGCKVDGQWFRNTGGARSKSKVKLSVPLTLTNLEQKRKGPPRRR